MCLKLACISSPAKERLLLCPANKRLLARRFCRFFFNFDALLPEFAHRCREYLTLTAGVISPFVMLFISTCLPKLCCTPFTCEGFWLLTQFPNCHETPFHANAVLHRCAQTLMFELFRNFFICVCTFVSDWITVARWTCRWWQNRCKLVAKNFPLSCARSGEHCNKCQPITCITVIQNTNCTTTNAFTHKPFRLALRHTSWRAVCSGSSQLACKAILWHFGSGFFLFIFVII